MAKIRVETAAFLNMKLRPRGRQHPELSAQSGTFITVEMLRILVI